MTLNIAIFGLSITSSWGNGHATTYRALAKALHARGHKVTFLERDVPWYRDHRDLAAPPYCDVQLYERLSDVPRLYSDLVADADMVILGSYVPDGCVLADWIGRTAAGVTAFYDIDTPITLAGLEDGSVQYITPALIPRFDLYLSFTGGPVLQRIEQEFGSPRARALYCAVDPELHAPLRVPVRWELGYLGTYSDDRQPAVDELLLRPAASMPPASFVVAGAQYPADLHWPQNVERIHHLPPAEHSAFYSAQRFTLNVTRRDMVAAGHSPSVRLFEAAACGVPIISDFWPGLEEFFRPGEEIFVARSAAEVLHFLQELPEERRLAVAAAARRRVLHEHTAAQRVRQLENYYAEASAGERMRTREAVA
jgi:spore maturation protein CgeB